MEIYLIIFAIFVIKESRPKQFAVIKNIKFVLCVTLKFGLEIIMFIHSVVVNFLTNAIYALKKLIKILSVNNIILKDNPTILKKQSAIFPTIISETIKINSINQKK